MRRTTTPAWLSFIGSLTLLACPALADSTWNAASGNWDQSGNWLGGVPSGTDAVTIANSGTALLPAGVSGTYGSLQVGAAGSGGVSISGGALSGSAATVGYSGTGTLTLSDGGVMQVSGGTGMVVLGATSSGYGTLNIGSGGAAGTLQATAISGGTGTGVVVFNHTGSLNFAPALTGALSVVQQGTGTTVLGDFDSDYTGGTTIQSGMLRIEAAATPLGTGTLTINGGAIGNAEEDGFVAVENNIAANADFSISALGENGAVEFFGNLDLGTDTTRTVTLTDTGLACFGGVISGQNLTLLSTGTSQAMVCSNTSNIFTGTLRVGAGVVLQLDKDDGNIAVPGAAVIDAGATMETWLSEQFSSTSAVTVNGTLRELYSETTSIAVLTGSGNIYAAEVGSPTQTLVIGSGTFQGTISEEEGVVQSVEKQGSGLLRLSGSNGYSGGTLIHSGTLSAGSNHAVGTGQVRVEGGVFLVEAGVDVSNTVNLAGGSYDRTFNSAANLANAVNASSSFSGGRDTTATILAGNLTNAGMLHTSFATASGALNDGVRLSDVYTFQGTETDLFVLQLSLSATGPNSYLAWLNTANNLWVNATEGNTGNNATEAQRGYAGDFASFQSLYGADLTAYIGAWGTETIGGVTTTWAVLDHNSDFAVVPEPGASALIALGLGAVYALQHRRGRK